MLKIGIVGSGGMGTVHYNNYAFMKNTQVAAVVGISPRAKKTASLWNVPLYPSITEMVNSADVDVVDICTPTFLHKPQVMESLSLGKNTIVEKPIALHREDAKAMFALANDKNCHLYVGQVLQFTKEIGYLRNMVMEQTFGKAIDGYFVRLSATPEWAQGAWLFDKEKSGLLPFDLHIHDLDIIISLFGKPLSTNIRGIKARHSHYVDHYRILYSFENMDIVAEAAWHHASLPFTANWRVTFENAVVIYDGTSLRAYPYHADAIEYNISDDVEIPTGINIPPTGWYLNELSHFADCIEQDMDSPYVSETQILSVLDILESINS